MPALFFSCVSKTTKRYSLLINYLLPLFFSLKSKADGVYICVDGDCPKEKGSEVKKKYAIQFIKVFPVRIQVIAPQWLGIHIGIE